MILELCVVVTAILVVTATFYSASPAAASEVPGTAEDAGPRLVASADSEGLQVSVLGPPGVWRGKERVHLPERQMEALAFLAVHPNGVTESEIRTALWGDRPSTSGGLRNLLWQLRRRLGAADASGEPAVAFAIAGRYRLHQAVACDLSLTDLDDSAGMRAMLKALRGCPFESRRGYEWAYAEGIVASVEARLVNVGESVASELLAAGDHAAAVAAVEHALRAVPADERLHRCLIEAFSIAGDGAAIDRAMERLVAIVGPGDPQVVIEPESRALYERVRGRPIAALASGGDGRA